MNARISISLLRVGLVYRKVVTEHQLLPIFYIYVLLNLHAHLSWSDIAMHRHAYLL